MLDIAIGIGVGLALLLVAVWAGMRMMEDKPRKDYSDLNRHTTMNPTSHHD